MYLGIPLDRRWYEVNDPIAEVFRRSISNQPILNNNLPQKTPVTISRSDTVRIDKNSRTDLLAKYPISWIAQHRYSASDIATAQTMLGARAWTEKAQLQSAISEMGY